MQTIAATAATAVVIVRVIVCGYIVVVYSSYIFLPSCVTTCFCDFACRVMCLIECMMCFVWTVFVCDQHPTTNWRMTGG